MLRDWIFMKARSRVEIDDALTVWQLKDAIKLWINVIGLKVIIDLI